MFLAMLEQNYSLLSLPCTKLELQKTIPSESWTARRFLNRRAAILHDHLLIQWRPSSSIHPSCHIFCNCISSSLSIAKCFGAPCKKAFLSACLHGIFYPCSFMQFGGFELISGQLLEDQPENPQGRTQKEPNPNIFSKLELSFGSPIYLLLAFFHFPLAIHFPTLSNFFCSYASMSGSRL